MKSQENLTMNSTKFDWKFKSEKTKKKKRQFNEKISRKHHNYPREISLNQIWNDTRKWRISKWIQWDSIEDSDRSENRRKNDMWKTIFAKCGENFTILAEKIHWIRTEMTGENVEFPNESSEVWLNAHIEVKMAGKREKRTTSERKIWKIYTKFHSLRPTNSLNQTENDRRKSRISKRIQRNSIEDSTGGANEKKKHRMWHIHRQFLIFDED